MEPSKEFNDSIKLCRKIPRTLKYFVLKPDNYKDVVYYIRTHDRLSAMLWNDENGILQGLTINRMCTLLDSITTQNITFNRIVVIDEESQEITNYRTYHEFSNNYTTPLITEGGECVWL